MSQYDLSQEIERLKKENSKLTELVTRFYDTCRSTRVGYSEFCPVMLTHSLVVRSQRKVWLTGRSFLCVDT